MSELLGGLSPEEQKLAAQLGNHLAYYAMKGESPPGGLGAALNQAPKRIRTRFGKILEVLDVMNSGGQEMRDAPFGNRISRKDLAQAAGVSEEVMEAIFDRWNTERLSSMLQGRMGTDASGGKNKEQLERMVRKNPGLTVADVQGPPAPLTRRDQVGAAMKAYDGGPGK